MAKLLYIGGPDVRFRIPLLLLLRERGFEIEAAGSEDGRPFSEHSIPYFRYQFDRGVNIFRDAAALRRLTYIFAETRPDIVHAFDTKPALLAPMAARAANISCVVRTIAGMGYVFSSGSLFASALRPAYRFFQKRASAVSDVTIFQNSDDFEYFVARGLLEREKAAIIAGSGIDVNAFHGQKTSYRSDNLMEELDIAGKVVITMIARLVRSKGVLDYLKAARDVRCRLGGDKVAFFLVGPTASEGGQAVSKEIIDDYKDVVAYLGERSDIRELLGVSDIFILPSYYREGVPRVLLEAGIMGLPIITTDMPGCRDVVRDGWNGILVPPRNPDKLRDAMLLLIKHRELRAKMGALSMNYIRDRFSLDRVASSHAEIYHRLLRKRLEIIP